MDRRAFLKTAASAGSLAAAGGFPAPAISQGAAAKTLRFVPQANLANFDPIWGTQYVVRNASQLVWDTLYGLDSKLQPKRQMVESEEVFERRPHLDVQAARRPEIPRRREGARQGRRGQHHPLDQPRQHGADAQGDPEGAHRGRRPHHQVGARQALSQDHLCARPRSARPAASSCRSASPRPTPSSRSTSTSAPARCGSCAPTGSPARSPPSRSSRTMCRATSRASGGRAARSCTSTASSG